MISFKLVNIDDLKDIMDIAVNAFAEDLKKYGSMPPGIERIKWHREAVKDGHYYKIVENSQIIGGMKICDKGEGHFHLGSIFIKESYQNRGIGHQAMIFLEKNFANAIKWTLDTPYKNYRNHYFYEKHGFKKVKEIKLVPNESFTLFFYEKILK